ncbi:hypothetical protein GLIP_1641 [Aliiglaciecola lipolytica E3]|uniref:Uncharacterized protein n=1 Tax=Aliiglaciecola lipolytica E3 TaxID=1127673 RepID=K6X0S6_9ALTE|nr:hypothetical protein GLIP_1641 [Aliiglaciecola lipolytica E3]
MAKANNVSNPMFEATLKLANGFTFAPFAMLYLKRFAFSSQLFPCD